MRGGGARPISLADFLENRLHSEGFLTVEIDRNDCVCSVSGLNANKPYPASGTQHMGRFQYYVTILARNHEIIYAKNDDSASG